MMKQVDKGFLIQFFSILAFSLRTPIIALMHKTLQAFFPGFASKYRPVTSLGHQWGRRVF